MQKQERKWWNGGINAGEVSHKEKACMHAYIHACNVSSYISFTVDVLCRKTYSQKMWHTMDISYTARMWQPVLIFRTGGGESRCQVDSIDTEVYSPLHYACRQGHQEVAIQPTIANAYPSSRYVQSDYSLVLMCFDNFIAECSKSSPKNNPLFYMVEVLAYFKFVARY